MKESHQAAFDQLKSSLDSRTKELKKAQVEIQQLETDSKVCNRL